ncbi:MAG: histidine--tRNA ligase [Rhodobacteraceae bacterium]|nr:histidine--tRNA ligase [Paracoccaceae bacterium]
MGAPSSPPSKPTAKGKKPQRQPRPKAAPPKGFRDDFGAATTARAHMMGRIAGVYHLYGFDALESSAVETVEALGKFLPDVERPNAGVFAWRDGEGEGTAEGGGEWLALRYDLTAPLARVYAQHRANLPLPYRRYAMGPVWRNEKPGPDRYRQFYQCDADTVGAVSTAADAEICAMLADILETLGLARGTYVVRLNNRKVLNGVLAAMGLAEDTSTCAAVLRSIDKFDKVGAEGVRQLLTGGRRDSSGAFIAGAGLSEGQADLVLAFLTAKAKTRESTLENLRHAVEGHSIGLEGVAELEHMVELLDAGGYGADRMGVDPSVVRGLGYYTGPVLEAELTFDILDTKGRRQQFGSIAGGGRYDGLIKRFTGQDIPATGMSIGVDRLLTALREKGQIELQTRAPVVITVMDRDRMADYQAMAQELRKAGIRAEVYLGNPKNFGNQLKYADRRDAAIAIIQGAEECAKDMLQIKDLRLGARIAQQATLAQWKQRPAQIQIPRHALVAQVRRLLDEQTLPSATHPPDP